MKKIVLFVLAIFLQADISKIINEIKVMQDYTPKFVNIKKYNIFSDIVLTEKKAMFKNNKDKKIKKTNFILNAIFQNKANINGLWVKLGSDIEGYKLVKILNDGVVLKKDKEIQIIILKSKILKVVK